LLKPELRCACSGLHITQASRQVGQKPLNHQGKPGGGVNQQTD
jgi:hypothetical protein